MTPIRLTYGSAALAWGRDQATSTKVLATESEQAVVRALPSAERGTKTAPALPPASTSTPQTPSSAGNRFARLLADIAAAHPEPVDNEVAAQGVLPEGVSTESSQSAEAHLTTAMRSATDRALRAASAAVLRNTPTSVATMADAIRANQREDVAVERRTQLEERARRIALMSPRAPLAVSSQLSLSYDQVAYVAPPKAQMDRRG